MNIKKLVLCLIIAMVFTFGIGTTNVLAVEALGYQELNINENTDNERVGAIVDETLVPYSNTEELEDAKNNEDDDIEKLAFKVVNEKQEIKETENLNKTTNTTTDSTKAVATKAVATKAVATKADSTKAVATKADSTKAVATKAVATKTVEKKYTNAELRLLSALIYSEAGNQSYKGKLAVANVVINRAKSNIFSHTDTIKEVIYDKKWGIQFSVIKKGSSGTSPLSRALSLYDSRTSTTGAVKENLYECIKAAKAALNGDNNIGSYLYFNGNSKYLSSKYSNHQVIGDHIFYNTK